MAARVAVVTLVWCGAGVGAAEAYVDAVPLPGTPAAVQASTLYYADGRTVLARVGTTDHSDVPLSAVPPGMRHAILAAEDRDFYHHAGVSLRGMLRAVVADARGGREGASTITQQYARNAFLTQDFSAGRKAREMVLAVKLERQYTKDQILERYLNTIYFGRGAYGIAAAAGAYFGVGVGRLTPAQGAVLAAAVKDPYHFDPAVDPAGARQRWRWIIAAERAQGWLDADPAYPPVRPAHARLDDANGLIVDQVERELAGHGVTPRELHTRGLRVVTTVDADAQRAAVRRVAGTLADQPAGLRAAVVAVDPATGGVRAYYGGAQGRGYFDDAAAPRPPASAFTPIVLAAALEQGIGYDSRWDGSSPRTFPGRGPLRNPDGRQCPDCTLRQAMVDSLRTPFYAVAQRVGAGRVRDTAYRLGVSRTYDGRQTLVDVRGDPEPGRTRADIALGRYAVTPADLASVYATFAAGGIRHRRHFVTSAAGPDGAPRWRLHAAGARVLSANAAADVSAVLHAVVQAGQARPDRPAAGEAGSQQWGDTHDNQDAWMAGYTPQLATAVWLGRSVPGPIRDRDGEPIEGGTVPARLWRDVTHDALTDTPPTALPPPAHLGRTDVGDAGARGRSRRAAHSPESGPESGSGSGSGESGTSTGDLVVVHTRHPGKRLALTFDDGPSPYTTQVLALLAEYGITATFCMVGEEVDRYPGIVRQVVARGHRLCNHSWRHDDLGVVSADVARHDMERTDAALARAVPGATVTYFRAPYGSWGGTAHVAAGRGQTPLGWLVDPDDWTMPGADVIAGRIRDQVTPRAVVLVHDGGGDRAQTVQALRTLIPELLADGWTFDLPETTVAARRLPSASPSGTPTRSGDPTSSSTPPPATPSSAAPPPPTPTSAVPPPPPPPPTPAPGGAEPSRRS
ncbi:transglycosylase domain-containing protein [Mangrovihabitans endophyticus]|uniref:NodB homology domain-containing protein n=1 Tax=Mangrovihabitans endophyticus TaxID=1751298 RepID=A0A8J3C153_9ACTN|nr:transglycosylase domain-containing protein [Mangrovihabitans endophyticus]GGL00274.1 hypothetical protein GCM10012284_38370 [Mangrovihabitans endophyticus]